MRKFTTLLVLMALLIATLGVAVSAETYIEKQPTDIQVEVKQANPNQVVKDGRISVGEYDKFTGVSIDDYLGMFYSNVMYYPEAEALAEGAEFYFSWDEVHGFNFALTYETNFESLGLSNGFNTSIPQGDPADDWEGKGRPFDNFAWNIGCVITFGEGMLWDDGTPGRPCLYYTIGRDIATGNYLEGHWNQLGVNDTYDPVAGTDFCVAYNGTKVTFEWSLPLSEIGEVAAAGTSFSGNITGTCGLPADFENLPVDQTSGGPKFDEVGTWGVSLGEFGFGMTTVEDSKAATFTLSDAKVAGYSDSPVEPIPTGSTPTSNNNSGEPIPTSNNNSGEPVPTSNNNSGEPVASSNNTQPTNTNNSNEPAGPTGDPMIIAAVIASISAAGIVIAKKRK